MKLLEKLNNLSKKRIEYFLLKWDNMSFYKGSETYWKQIRLELDEAEQEINTNKVYLEDELWDVLWDYLCLLNSLKKEWKIDSLEKVIERAFTKYSWRINEQTWDYNWSWQEIKQKQKEKLLEEIKNLDNKD